MRWWIPVGYGLSIAVHMGLAAGVNSIPKQTGHRATTVTVFEAKPKKKAEPEKEDKPKPPDPPKPLAVPKQILKMAAEPPPTDNTPPPSTTPTPPGHAAMAALPDFGLSMGGGVGGIGIAVPVGGATGPASNRGSSGGGGGEERKVKALAPKSSDPNDTCLEEATKPKPTERAQAQYIGSAAQAAGIEGVLRVEFSVDAAGQVSSVRVVDGSNPKLDELALSAARRWKFNSATKCGKPVSSKYTITMRFKLGD